MIGRTLGHYRIVEKLGAGGMGVVYRARDERLDRDVALKVLPAEMIADAAALKLFRQEAQALSKLNHPNIATIHDFDKQDGLSFLVMEYIPGTTLDQKIAAGTFLERDVVRLGVQLAQGLQAAHCKGVVHRDLKPSNLRITPDRRLKILDFGLARLMVPGDQDATRTSLEAHPEAGTLPYMSPEQLQGEPADERSDIYAAGAVLYEMATGQRLFPGKHGTGLIDAILHQSARLPCELNSHVSAGMQSIIQKALDKESEHRYQSAKELQVDLERLSIGSAASQSAPYAEHSGTLPLEIAHVLFMDIVAYAKLPIDQQRLLLEELQKTVRGTSEFARAKSADKLISLPSVDGTALVFFDDPEAPCRCALEVSRTLRGSSETRLRMGIHTGPVYRVADINANRNVAGGGINIAQVVMDCGDSGHILMSKAVADALTQVSCWNSSLHDLGEAEIKPGVRVHLFNLYTEEAGNSKVPKKLSSTKASHRSDSGGTQRFVRVGSHHKHRSAIRSPGEIKIRAVSTRLKETKLPALPRERQDGSSTSIRRRIGLFGAAILVLGAAAFTVRTVRHGVFSHNVFSHNASALKAPPAGIPPLAEGKFLAVLPFNVEGDPKVLGSVAEGLNQELSTKLLALRDVRVASARAAENIDQRGSLETIARTLASNLIVHGTVRGDDKKIQISVDLDDVPSGRHVLSQEKFSGMRRDLLSLEDQIYTRILQALELNPSGEEMNRAASRPTDDPEAYELYNKGRSAYRGHPDVNQVKTAIGFYRQALARDGSFALANASLADASLRMYSETHDTAWIQKATDAAELAQRLDDNLKEAHLSLGRVYLETGKTDEAIKELRRALQLSPRSDECYRLLGRAYLGSGRKEQGIISLQNAVTLNLYYWPNQNELGIAYSDIGEYAKALTAFRRVVELDPTNPIGRQNIGAVYYSQAKYEQSIPEFESAIALQSSNPDVFSNLGMADLILGRYTDGLKMLQKATNLRPNDQGILGNLADGYRWSGQQKKAMETYDKAISLANKDLDVNPKDAGTLGNLALYHAKKGNASLANYYIHRARSIDASDPQLIYNEAVTQALASQPDAAIESLRSALEKGVPPEQAMLEPEFSRLRMNPAFQKLLSDFPSKQ
jgi:serine/threonine protein kinase/tetratricopeptide (TPR) repeat protein